MGLIQRINSLQKKVQNYNKKIADLNKRLNKEKSAYAKAVIKIKLWGYRALTGILNRVLSGLRSLVGKYNEVKSKKEMAEKTKSIEERKKAQEEAQEVTAAFHKIINWGKAQAGKVKETMATKISQVTNRMKSAGGGLAEKAKGFLRRGAKTAEEVAKKAEKVHA